MTSDSIRMHLRAALDEVISSEKKRLHEFYDKGDANIARRIERMRPFMEALAGLRDEVGDVKGLSISLATHGHMATIDLNESASRKTLSISTTHDNAQFEVQERTYHSFDAETHQATHRLSSVAEALEYVVAAVGKHVASSEVFAERKRYQNGL